MATSEGKRSILKALDGALPDDASLDDAIDYLWYLRQIEEGLVEAETGHLIPHEEVVKQIEQWLK
jgi:predicted transcriptional regulator